MKQFSMTSDWSDEDENVKWFNNHYDLSYGDDDPENDESYEVSLRWCRRVDLETHEEELFCPIDSIDLTDIPAYLQVDALAYIKTLLDESGIELSGGEQGKLPLTDAGVQTVSISKLAAEAEREVRGAAACLGGDLDLTEVKAAYVATRRLLRLRGAL